MASRSLTKLHIRMQPLAHAHLRACDDAGLEVLLVCTLRSGEEQAALYAQGRCELLTVNDLRHVAGMPPIGADENNHTVTAKNRGDSLHEYGLAYDLVPIDGGVPVWSVHSPLWEKVGVLGEQCGLTWGGRWVALRDRPHFQWTDGLSLADIKNGRMQIPEDAT